MFHVNALMWFSDFWLLLFFKPKSLMESELANKIVTYPLDIDPHTGNSQFQIKKVDRKESDIPPEFLIPHRKDYFFFALVIDAKEGGRHWIDMKPYDILPKTLYFTHPSQVQLKEESYAIISYALSVSKEFLSLDPQNGAKELPIIQNAHKAHQLHLAAEDFQFIENILSSIFKEYHQTKDWQHSMLQSYVNILLVYCSRLYTQQFKSIDAQPESLILENFRELIEMHYKTQHEVSQYADLLHISAGYLGEMIKQQSGKSAIKHIQDRIILEAKRLIYFSENSMKEIAFNLGFEDASYFNRFFKRHTGFTPLAYKTHIRKMYH